MNTCKQILYDFFAKLIEIVLFLVSMVIRNGTNEIGIIYNIIPPIPSRNWQIKLRKRAITNIVDESLKGAFLWLAITPTTKCGTDPLKSSSSSTYKRQVRIPDAKDVTK